MTPRERSGRLIALAVITVLMGGCVTFFFWDAIQMAKTGVTHERVSELLRNIIFAGFWFAMLIALTSRGHQAVRWVLLATTGLFAAGICGTAVWMTTLDYPTAATPEARAAMQKDDRDSLPVCILQGAFPLLVTLPLFLPPVGDYLAYRRLVTANLPPLLTD